MMAGGSITTEALSRTWPSHPRFAAAVDVTAASYDRAAGGRAARVSPERELEYPRSEEDLRWQVEEFAGLEGSRDMTRLSTYSGLLGMQTAADRLEADLPVYAGRVREFVHECRRLRRRCVPTITDSKADRRKGPGQQADPDQYLHVVDRRDGGVVLRRAKLHIRGAALVHELLVLPTKRMKPGEEEWAIACAVPVNAPGLKVVNVVPGGLAERDDVLPLQPRPHHSHGLRYLRRCVCPERARIPVRRDRALGYVRAPFGVWDRISNAGLMAADTDLYVGLAQLLAEANGVDRVHHVRDKIAELVLHATMVRAGVEAAIANASMTAEGFLVPSELYTNAAKHHASTNIHRMMMLIQDIAGGSLINAPLPGDLESEEIGALVKKYMRGIDWADGEYRARLLYGARDIVADTYAATGRSRACMGQEGRTHSGSSPAGPTTWTLPSSGRWMPSGCQRPGRGCNCRLVSPRCDSYGRGG